MNKNNSYYYNNHCEVTFVTELFTLKAGTFSSPFFIILTRLAIPVVVSSDNPFIPRGGGEEIGLTNGDLCA